MTEEPRTYNLHDWKPVRTTEGIPVKYRVDGGHYTEDTCAICGAVRHIYHLEKNHGVPHILYLSSKSSKLVTTKSKCDPGKYVRNRDRMRERSEDGQPII